MIRNTGSSSPSKLSAGESQGPSTTGLRSLYGFALKPMHFRNSVVWDVILMADKDDLALELDAVLCARAHDSANDLTVLVHGLALSNNESQLPPLDLCVPSITALA
ncbi:hypothetical protein C8J56DRAFT_1064464 [Mycena floridula]|nr:hypothetical protein C8J56DRAFT_1064464 [Mycena floridula]